LVAYDYSNGRSLVNRTSCPVKKEYVWAEVGALLGAILSVAFAVVVVVLFRGYLPGDLEKALQIALIALFVMLTLGSSFGCWIALKKAGHYAPKKVAGMLFLLLLVMFLAAVASTQEGFPKRGFHFEDFEVQNVPEKLLPPPRSSRS
jgi:hypothetical protein